LDAGAASAGHRAKIEAQVQGFSAGSYDKVLDMRHKIDVQQRQKLQHGA
jgi:hypothetical protein